MVEVKQLRVVLYERRGGIARQELWVPQDVLQKQDVGLHPSDLELIQSTLHLLNRMDVAVGPHYDLQITKRFQLLLNSEEPLWVSYVQYCRLGCAQQSTNTRCYILLQQCSKFSKNTLPQREMPFAACIDLVYQFSQLEGLDLYV